MDLNVPGTFEIRIALKNKKDYVIYKMIKQIIVIPNFLSFSPDL